MGITEFLQRYVDGYLLHDLENMATFTTPLDTDGAMGYSMMVITLAGMELLGNLLMPNTDPFKTDHSNDYFLNYWNNFFSSLYPAYKGLGRLFRQLIRHGIAHSFVGKPGIFIIKDKTTPSVSLDRERKVLCVNAVAFYRDFKNSYEKNVKTIIDGTAKSPPTNIQTMQSRLDSMIHQLVKDAEKEFRSLSDLDPSLGITVVNIVPTGSSGASEYPSPINAAPTGVLWITPPTEK